MDNPFAKKLLMKYGWKEGEGIGKNSDGIIKPIKANLKFDNAGLCYDRAQEFTNHWWQKAFNDAANNLNISNSSENVSLSTKDESIEISTTGITKKKLKNKEGDEKYHGHFQKSNKTHDQESVSFNTDNDDRPSNTISSNYSKILTDEDILKACGGRTAHKGARHGLSLSGKLSRIDAQEQQMLEKMCLNTETAASIFKDWIEVKKKRKKRNKVDKIESIEKTSKPQNLDSSSESIKLNLILTNDDNIDAVPKKSKKKLKKERQCAEELSKSFIKLKTDDDNSTDPITAKLHKIQDSSKSIKKHKRKEKKSKKCPEPVSEDIEEMNEEPSLIQSKKKKKDKRKKDPLVKNLSKEMKKNSKKKKIVNVVSKELTPFECQHLVTAGSLVPREKKKRDKKKEHKERASVNKLTKKINQLMTFDD